MGSLNPAIESTTSFTRRRCESKSRQRGLPLDDFFAMDPDAVHDAETEHGHEHKRAGVTGSPEVSSIRADMIWRRVFAVRRTGILVATADDFKISDKELLPKRPGFL